MEKIKILEVIGDSSLAGAPRHLLSVVENLSLDKFEIHAVCPPGPLAGEIRKLRRHVDLEVVPMRQRLDFKAIADIRKVIKQVRPDVIHVHGTRAGVLGRIAAIGFNLPVIYTEHLWTKQYKLQNRFLNLIHYFANWALDIFTTLNIAVSGAVKDFMVTSNISHLDKVKVIYNGIEDTHHQAHIFRHETEFLLATVGTLNQQKGMQYLIRAIPQIIKEFPGVQLEIIGDGPYKRILQNEVRKLKLKSFVKFIGFVPDVSQYLTRFDLYVQPSISESFGLAIVQAMSVGLPVVATNAGGIPEVVTEGKSGFLVESADPKALADRILELLRHPSLAKKMGEMGKREAKMKFNIKDMINDLEMTYESVSKNSAFLE